MPMTNKLSALCYMPFLGWVPAVILLLVGKERVVKWHAAQGVLMAAGTMAAMLFLRFTIILSSLQVGVMTFVIIVQLIMAVKAFQGEKVRLPYLSDWADKAEKKG